MEGFTVNTPPEGSAPPLTPVELSPERMQSIGVRTGRIEYKTINSDIRATGTVDVDERRVAPILSLTSSAQVPHRIRDQEHAVDSGATFTIRPAQ